MGIIANPASGKDIRRLTAYGSVFDNAEKSNMVKRIILGLDAAGVESLSIMPDIYGIGLRAIKGLRNLSIRVEILDMVVEDDWRDSARAAFILANLGARVIVVLGGDGTNRAVVKGCKGVPLVPLSTGTNNVFPYMMEATVAGLAAGYFSRGVVGADCLNRHKILNVYRNGKLIDVALIDAVVIRDAFIGAKAIWRIEDVVEVFATRGEPDSVGLSSIIGNLRPVTWRERIGGYIRVGGDGRTVEALIAPGLVRRVPVGGFRLIRPGERMRISTTPSIIALDGEREISVRSGDDIEIELSEDGPRVVDVKRTLLEAMRKRI
ncbi:MAG: ATP-NAD kinase family protein [bacterium]